MDFQTAAIIALILMCILLTIGIPIVYVLFISAIPVAVLALGGNSLDKMGWDIFYLMYGQVWSPLPLFTFMACVMAETPIGEHTFRAARNWFNRIPGALVIGSIWGEAAMAATIGSSSATLLAVGKVAVPEFERFGYNKGFGLGGLLCGGVLGPLIPPSGTMIMFSILTSTSLGRLFIGGLIPGILLAVMLSLCAYVMCVRNPKWGPPASGVTWKERWSSLTKIWPVAVVFLGILGSIYAGVATATESGGFGCFLVLVIAVLVFKFRFKNLFRAMKETALLNAMLFFIFTGAVFFTYVVGTSSLADSLINLVNAIHVPPILVVIIIQILLLVLGTALDGITIMLLTIPIFAPLVAALGFDLVWFGVLYCVNMEIALISPPLAVNFFLVQTVFDVNFSDLWRGSVPFLGTLVVFLIILVVFPDITTWLPNTMH
jgi:C4-dicarboxylate transporter, DctM subunit